MNRYIVKRNLPTVLVIVLVSAVILFCLILGVMQARGPEDDGESGGDATISFPLIEPDGSAELIVSPNVTWEPSPVRDQYEMDEEILFLAAINQPIFSGLNAEAATKIHSVLDEYCRDFVRISSDDKVLIEEAYDGSPFGIEPFERSGDYTVFVKGHVVSVLFNLFHDYGGADTGYENRAFAFDLTTGDLLSFSDYTGKDEDFGRSYILSVVGQMIRNAPDQFYTDALDVLAATVNLYDYYLTDEALVLFFNPDTLAPSAQGPITLNVPYSNLGK